MEWREYYKSHMVSAEDAIKAIKPGDRVAFAYGTEPLELGLALLARTNELAPMELVVPAPGRDFGWYDPGWEEIFRIEIAHVLPVSQQAITEKRADYIVSGLTWAHDPSLRPPVDVLLIQVSTPDHHGFCSFGASHWDKKRALLSAKCVVAEVNKDLIRTYGDNHIHVSEIDYFVEHVPSGRMPGATDMLGRKTTGPGQIERTIAEYIGSIIKDRDTMEIGVGGTAEWVARLGILKNKTDLGWHSENTPPGIATLIKEGVITGKYKNIHTGKGVATACGGGTKEEMDFLHMNPVFEIYPSEYVLDPRVISAHDNMVAINSALSVDLTGQIAAEAIGPTMVSGSGGQLTFAIGASLSKGGRSVVALPSTAKGGTLSRITPALTSGTIVTVPRTLADIIVTEYGIARLRGKTQRERAMELIGIAHPDFRSELTKEAKKLFWP